MLRSLTNKVALVTGSTSGIGLGIAEVLASQGATVVLNGFGDNVEELVAKIERDHGVPCMYSGADMLRRDDIEAMIKGDIKSKFGTVDILVNNCGMQHVSPVESFDDDMFERVLALNLTSNFYTTKHVIGDMRQNGYGRIINVASTHGKVASVNKSAYVASKHGVVGFTKTIALETAKDSNLTCNGTFFYAHFVSHNHLRPLIDSLTRSLFTRLYATAVCPGFVLTPLVSSQIESRAAANGTSFDQASKDLLREKVPSEEFVTVEALGHLCAFLCTDHGKQITGQAIAADGGWTSQ